MISLNNIKMRNKLMLMLALPVLSMLYFSIGSLISSYDTANRMDQLQNSMVLAGKISLMVHEVQKERGMSAGYLGSKGEKFANELMDQRHLTDKRIADLKDFVESFEGGLLDSKLESAATMILPIASLRSKVTDLHVSVGDAVITYTAVNTAYLDVISEIVNGKRSITADTALRLQRYFGIEAQFWLNLQTEYDLRIMKRKIWSDIEKRIIPAKESVIETKYTAGT